MLLGVGLFLMGVAVWIFYLLLMAWLHRANTPGYEEILVRLNRHLPQWNLLDERAYRLGMFGILQVSSAVVIVLTMLTFNVNPTLVLSVLAAPLWITVIICCWKASNYFTQQWKDRQK